MRKFTKKEVISMVREQFRDMVERGDAQRGDDIMRREMFNNLVDSLHEDRAVPDNAPEWSNPF